MMRRFIVLLLVLVTLANGLVSCRSGPTSSVVQSSILEEATIRMLCLEVEQSYPQMKQEFSLPIAAAARRILTGLGLQVVTERDSCDTTLTLTVRGRALETEDLGGRCYTRAEISGQLRLTSPEHRVLEIPVSEAYPPQQLSAPLFDHCPEKPEDAPFDEVWPKALLDGLTHLWGPRVLLQALKDENKDVRTTAASALGRTGPEEDVIPALVQALGDENEEVRSAVAYALGQIGVEAEEAVPALLQTLEDEDEKVRGSAAWALSRIGPEMEGTTPALIHLLEDEDEGVRSAAAFALGQIGPEAVSAIAQTLENDEWEIREAAAEALWRIGPGEGTASLLIRAMEDEDWRVRRTAAGALGGIGPEAGEVVPPLIQALRDENEYVRQAAAFALRRIGPEEGVIPALVQALEDESARVRSAAAWALEQMGSEAIEAVPALISALEDERHDVCTAALLALNAITGQNFGQDVARWQQWWEERR